MRIACIGGGPASLCFAASVKRRQPTWDVDVFDQNRRADFVGWGIVLPDQLLALLDKEDPITHSRIVSQCKRWDRLSIIVQDQEPIRCRGNHLSSIARTDLLAVLRDRAET